MFKVVKSFSHTRCLSEGFTMQQILQTQAFFVFAVLTKPKTQLEITGMTLIKGTTKKMCIFCIIYMKIPFLYISSLCSLHFCNFTLELHFGGVSKVWPNMCKVFSFSKEYILHLGQVVKRN